MTNTKSSIHGRSLIGFSLGEEGEDIFHAENPATGERLEPGFHAAGEGEWRRAVELAEQAFPVYSLTDGKTRGRFLRAIAAEIEGAVEAITLSAVAETGLPAGRIAGETARTAGQLRLFAGLVEEGSWVDARIDRAIPDRLPVPKPDLRSMLQPIGPVVVFGASNFPLAFSVAGGDTASALAAGNPVIVKAHHAHPATAELAGSAILRAVRACDLPEGTFSMVHGPSQELGLSLARHPAVKAVAFTGSRQGGRALFDAAASRPEPIPVVAEMSSINPLFLLAGALKEKSRSLAEQYHASLTLGVGQFCTNPGLVVLPDGDASKEFLKVLGERIRETPHGVMLHRGIRRAYSEGVASREAHPDAKPLAVVKSGEGPGGCSAAPAVFTTDGKSFLKHREFGEEIFGPSAIVVLTSSAAEFERIAGSLEGQLTASIFGTEAELYRHGALVATLRRKAGRVLFNQFPTGVEVCHAMVHGGPYPATSDGRSTSVGTAAIGRFARPVCFQNFPQMALPSELQDENPLQIWRKEDGNFTK